MSMWVSKKAEKSSRDEYFANFQPKYSSMPYEKRIQFLDYFKSWEVDNRPKHYIAGPWQYAFMTWFCCCLAAIFFGQIFLGKSFDHDLQFRQLTGGIGLVPAILAFFWKQQIDRRYSILREREKLRLLDIWMKANPD